MRLAPVALALLVSVPTGGACVIDELREDDVGDASFCDAARRWPRAYAELEDELFELVNAARARSAHCADMLQSPAGPLELQPELRCAARRHATFLAQRDTTGHEGYEGRGPHERAGHADYDGSLEHELIARDFSDPEQVVDAWLGSRPHCLALYRRGIEHVGIGHSRSADGNETAWVLVTGRERQ